MYRRLDRYGCGYMGGWCACETIRSYARQGSKRKEKGSLAISGQRIGTGRCIETNDWVLGLLTTSSLSSSYNRHPSVRLFLFLFLSSRIPAPDPVSHRSRLSFRILKFHESRRWFLMAVRYDAGRAPFRFSPSVLPAPPPSAAAATGISAVLPLTSYRLSEEEHLRRSSRSATTAHPPLSSLPYRVRRDRRYWSAIDLVIPAD